MTKKGKYLTASHGALQYLNESKVHIIVLSPLLGRMVLVKCMNLCPPPHTIETKTFFSVCIHKNNCRTKDMYHKCVIVRWKRIQSMRSDYVLMDIRMLESCSFLYYCFQPSSMHRFLLPTQKNEHRLTCKFVCIFYICRALISCVWCSSSVALNCGTKRSTDYLKFNCEFSQCQDSPLQFQFDQSTPHMVLVIGQNRWIVCSLLSLSPYKLAHDSCNVFPYGYRR